MSRSRDSRRYRNAAKRLRGKDNICWICQQPIDLSLPYTHKMSWTADHLHPIAMGGSVHGEIRPAHRSCNTRRGIGRNPGRINNVENRTSREW